MIAHLRGELVVVGPDSVVVDVNGVGYKAFMPLGGSEAIPEIGSEIRLFTTTYVREDIFSLFGFLSEEQRGFFEVLIGVAGVGPRVALALLSVLSTGEIASALSGEDPKPLQRAPGVGLKLAQRIILELKDRVAALPRSAGVAAPASDAASDAVSALQSLGYTRQDASKSVEAALKEAEDPTDTSKLVRTALRLLTRSR